MCFFSCFFVCKNLFIKKKKSLKLAEWPQLQYYFVIMKIFIKNVVITKIFIKNVVYNYNACRLTVYEMHNYTLFCLYLAVILKNSVNNKFIKLVEQQLKLINYSESESDFSFAINAQCYILALLLNLTLNLNLTLVQYLWILTLYFLYFILALF